MKKLFAIMLAAAMIVAVLIIPAVAAGEKPALPTATVTPIPEEDLDPEVPLTFALKFKADEVTEEQLAYYQDWYADFELTLNKSAVFCAGSETADAYLSGQYDAWSENWISVPFEDVTLEADQTLKIMEYAASLMNQPGLKITYIEVLKGVVEFDCGVFFKEEYLAENTDLVVTLSLQMYNPEDETENYSVGPVYTFYVAAATITDAEENVAYYATLEEAIEAAKDGDTIVLRNDVVLPEGETITVEKNVTLDLNNCMVTNAEALVIGEGKCLKVDGQKYTVNDHDQNVVVPGSAATCTEAGKTEGKNCSVCGKVMVAQEVIPAGHKLTKIDAKAPTYTAEGNIEHYICSVCGELFADAEAKTSITDKASVVIPQLIKVEEEKAEVSTGAVDNAIADAKEKAEETGKPVEVVIEVNKAVEEDKSEDTEDTEDNEGEAEKPVEVVRVELPVASLESVAKEEASLTVVMPSVTVTVDTEALKTVTEQAAGSTVTLVVEPVKEETLTEKQQETIKKYEVAVAIKAEFICQETQEKIWTESSNENIASGSVTVKMPFTPAEGTKGSDYTVLYIADDGSVKKIDTAFEEGHLVFALEHFSEYVVVNTKANADPSNPATGMTVAPVIALLVINAIGAGAVVAGKKRFF